VPISSASLFSTTSRVFLKYVGSLCPNVARRHLHLIPNNHHPIRLFTDCVLSPLSCVIPCVSTLMRSANHTTNCPNWSSPTISVEIEDESGNSSTICRLRFNMWMVFATPFLLIQKICRSGTTPNHIQPLLPNSMQDSCSNSSFFQDSYDPLT